MGIIGLDHVQLAMPSGRETDARAFYSALLGLEEVEKPDGLAGRGGCWFALGAVKIHLGVEQDFAPALKAHPALLTDNIAMLETRLIASGYRTKRDVDIGGYQRFFVSDPFGNRIEIMQMAKD